MTITAADIAKLRKITGAGMMDCKVALNEANGDFDAAIDYLRKKGKKISAKRADREASEGVVVATTSMDSKKGIIVEVNCETDFVANTPDFINFVNNTALVALDKNPDGIEELKELTINSVKIADLLDEMVARIGEKIELSSYKVLNGTNIAAYNHFSNKIGVLVSINKEGEQYRSAAKDVAMQVAALNPVAVDRERVPESVIAREAEIAKEQTRLEGKPENMLDKITQGKMNKFFKENTLLTQDFVKDSSKTVEQFLKELDKDLTIEDFIRVGIAS